MAVNSKAYVYPINPHGSSPNELFDTVSTNTSSTNTSSSSNQYAFRSSSAVHEVSPAWVLTFVRWDIRDTLRTAPSDTANFQTVRKGDPLVVENDCIQVSVVVDKGTLTDSMNAVLKITDVNYETAIAPGDFVFVNMLNWEEYSRNVANKARAKQPINNIYDGFKGLFKVQGVRKVLSVDPGTGRKAFFVKITGYAFTELNNKIYFNTELFSQPEKDNILLFVANLSTNWNLIQNAKDGLTNVQDIISALIDMFLGTGIGDSGKTLKGGIIRGTNTLYFMPVLVSTLLNVPGGKAAKDIYNFIMGIQQYSSNLNQGMASGMNPSNFQSGDSRIWAPVGSENKCQGDTIAKPEYWNQQQVWSIFQQWSNSPLNELFTCFRVSPNGNIMPTVVFRQIPFTNDDFDSTFVGTPPQIYQVTRFMNLPRWKLNPSLVLSLDIGRDESARFNFVQYYGRSVIDNAGYTFSFETAAKNYLYDIDDVKRNGLRPYVVTTSFDEAIIKGKKQFQAVGWAKILGDALIGGQLKMNGTIESAGIVEPIAVGDNLQFDGVVYHIERVSHSCSIDAQTGRKIFRTSLGLSHGISIGSASDGLAYNEMTYSNAYALRNIDGNTKSGNEILPGVSESQDVIYRPISVDIPHAMKKGEDGSFQQPNKNTSSSISGTENEWKEDDNE